MKRGVLIFGWLVGAFLLQGLTATAQTPRPPAAARRPQLWAILVGVGSPLDPKIRQQSSREAVQQTFSVLRWFNSTAGWNRSHLLLLTDFGGNRNPGTPQSPAPNIAPTRENLDWAFREWLAPRAQPGDVILFYFAGQARAVAPQGPTVFPEYYLLPTDVLSDNLAARGWSLDKALTPFARQGKFKIICWLGTALQAQPAAAGANLKAPDLAALSRDWLRRLARWPETTVWLAANRPAVNPTADPSITFTQALLAGFGKPSRRLNLAACLRSLERNSQLKLQGFQSIGGVPPELTLWADQFGQAIEPPQPEMVLQVGHADRIMEIVSTPDSRQVITASQDSTVRVWSPEQKALLRVLTGHAVGVTAMALSADGRWLVSGGGRGNILVRDLTRDFASHRVLRQPYDEGSRVVQIAMLPDGVHFVTTDRLGRGFLWDLSASSLTPKPLIEGVVCREVACGGDADSGTAAAWCGDGTIRIFSPSGAGGAVLPAPGGTPTAIAVSPSGRLLAVGLEDGRVLLRDLVSGRQIDKPVAAGPIRRLEFSSLDALAVGHDQGLRLVPVTRGPNLGEAADLMTGRGPEKMAFSPAGQFLAACARDTGALQVWRLDGDQARQTVINDDQAGVFSLAFSSGGRELITGTKLGSVKTWPLEARGENPPWTRLAHRGKVKHLAASPGRRFVLLVNELHQAQLWDLAERTCRKLPGTWSSGVFLSDDTLVVADRPENQEPGRLVRLDRRTLAPAPTFYARSSGQFKVPPEVRFEAVTLSPDGTRIAASASRSQIPLVCVWDANTGRLTHWITDAVLDDPVFSLSFSADARELLTAGNSPEVKLWDLKPREGALESPAVTFQDSSSRDVTCVQVRPGRNRQMVTGHSDGRLLLWSWAEGKAREETPVQVLAERFFVGAVHAVTFTPEGRYLAAAGDGTAIWLAEMEPKVRPIRNLGSLPHHFEQINCLTAWPDLSALVELAVSRLVTPGLPVIGGPPRPPMLISGSDDTTVKFWDLEQRALWGTFCMASPTAEAPAPAEAEALRDLEWVLYTPDGHFDASEKGRELVRYRQGDRGHPMEQFDATALYSFELSERLRAGKPPQPERLNPPPPVAIEPPLRDDPTVAEAQLTITLGAADLKDVRLYHNGVPIPSGLEEVGPPLPDQFSVRVKLLPGTNRFYAMASRDGAFDSRSKEVELAYDAPAEPGRLHVIALGVGNYKREQLTFAKRDAERLSEVLHARGFNPKGSTGLRLSLTDDRVNARNVNAAFNQVAKEVRGHPEDTVVLFLAGHTGVFDNQRFCLLLSKFPFPEESPLIVAARGTAPALAPGTSVDPDDVLPYNALAIGLMRLEALNRLVIVDACQAEAIYADPQVAAVRKWMEIGSRKARTSYLMAARRGEPALEVEPLGHGLFTYTLLRGMREVLPRDELPEITSLKLRSDADFNRDGQITTAELDSYVKETLPPLSALFPQMVVSRQAPTGARPTAVPPATADDLDQALRLQSARVSFPLIQIGPAPGSKP